MKKTNEPAKGFLGWGISWDKGCGWLGGGVAVKTPCITSLPSSNPNVILFSNQEQITTETPLYAATQAMF